MYKKYVEKIDDSNNRLNRASSQSFNNYSQFANYNKTHELLELKKAILKQQQKQCKKITRNTINFLEKLRLAQKPE